MSAYTRAELMVVAAARQIKDGEVVFVGMRLPLIAFALAKNTHAPRAVGLFENGIIRDRPSAELLYTMSDTPNIIGANSATRMSHVMALLAQGAVDVGFIGGAEIDRCGNVNSSYIYAPAAPGRVAVKLPGSGGGCDIASLARRLLVIMPHEKHRFRERVDYITSTGYGSGPGYREAAGLPRGGPATLISTLGVFGFDARTGECFLQSYHPGSSVEEVRANTGWDLQVAADVTATPPPTAAEIAIIRRYDPQGFWTRR